MGVTKACEKGDEDAAQTRAIEALSSYPPGAVMPCYYDLNAIDHGCVLHLDSKPNFGKEEMLFAVSVTCAVLLTISIMRLLPDVVAGMAKMWDWEWDLYPSVLRKRVRQEKETPPVAAAVIVPVPRD